MLAGHFGQATIALGAVVTILVSLSGTRDGALAALQAAQHLDHTLLIYFANAAAYTGIMLAALTPWGFFRYWWVTVKFALTASRRGVVPWLRSPGAWRSRKVATSSSGRRWSMSSSARKR